MKAKYDKAEVNVNKICDVLDGHQRQLLKDIAILAQMYAQILNLFKELTMYSLERKSWSWYVPQNSVICRIKRR